MAYSLHEIGTLLLFPCKSTYVKIYMLKSVPKTEKTKNAPRREVHFCIYRAERNPGTIFLNSTVQDSSLAHIELQTG